LLGADGGVRGEAEVGAHQLLVQQRIAEQLAELGFAHAARGELTREFESGVLERGARLGEARLDGGGIGPEAACSGLRLHQPDLQQVAQRLLHGFVAVAERTSDPRAELGVGELLSSPGDRDAGSQRSRRRHVRLRRGKRPGEGEQAREHRRSLAPYLPSAVHAALRSSTTRPAVQRANTTLPRGTLPASTACESGSSTMRASVRRSSRAP
jgi:hypothetical protein